MDFIVVGAGFSGATAANILAKSGKKVLLIERRPYVGGNMYDYKDASGSYVHKYGPHIFHTQIERVYKYLQDFAEFYPYYHKVYGSIDGQIVPIPFNFESIDKLFDAAFAQKYKDLLQKTYGTGKVTINQLMQSSDADIQQLAQYVYDKVFFNYTNKQWGVSHPSELDGQVTARVPVALSYQNGYFTDKYQAMPKKGYKALFDNMLKHPNITIRTDIDALKLIEIDQKDQILFEGTPFGGGVIFTGQIDELFEYRFGRLEYRTVDFEFKTLPQHRFQSNSVINYPNDHKYTRITEFKHFMQNFPATDSTTIMYEFPREHNLGDEPYYPVPKTRNAEVYRQYQAVAEKVKGLHLLGRLAQYKYFNMDQAIDMAMTLCEDLLK